MDKRLSTPDRCIETSNAKGLSFIHEVPQAIAALGLLAAIHQVAVA